MFTQLNPPIPVKVIDKGPGLAFAVIDYGPEHNLIWVTAIDDSGEIWCAPNPKVRMGNNWTMGRQVKIDKNDCGDAVPPMETGRMHRLSANAA